MAKVDELLSQFREANVLSLDQLRVRQAQAQAASWSLAAMRGRLVEVSARGASAVLTTAVSLVVQAQQASEPVVWITLAHASFYPPDVAASGVDLQALVVIRVGSDTACLRAAEQVLRSGAVGLVVIDFAMSAAAGGHRAPLAAAPVDQPQRRSARVATRSDAGRELGEVFIERRYSAPQARRQAPREPITALATSVHSRLLALAQQHDAAVVYLTEKTAEATSLGSLVSLRAEALRQRREAQHMATIRVVKDKTLGPGFTSAVACRVPPGFTGG